MRPIPVEDAIQALERAGYIVSYECNFNRTCYIRVMRPLFNQFHEISGTQEIGIVPVFELPDGSQVVEEADLEYFM